MKQRTVTPEEIEQIHDLLNFGFSQRAVSEMTGLSRKRIEYYKKYPNARPNKRTCSFIPYECRTSAYSNAWQKQERLKDPIKIRLRLLRQKCRALGLEFNLDRTDFPEEPICPIFGTRLVYHSNEKDQYRKASVDRVDPTKGYTKDNIEIISLRANTLKSNLTKKELHLFLDYIEKHEQKNLEG